MAYKILTKNGIDNTNIDGARAEYFNSGMRNGIVKGALNEGGFRLGSSNSIILLDTCELRISGHRIIIDEPVYHTFSNIPLNDTKYSFIAQIDVDDNSNVEFTILIQDSNTPLIQQNLFSSLNGAGRYQVEIGNFILTTNGELTNIKKTINIITGGTLGDGYATIDYVDNLVGATLDEINELLSEV